MTRQFHIGDKVQSVFRSRWHGIVVDEDYVKSIDGKLNHPICVVKPLLTVDGRPQRKARLRSLSEAWLRPSTRPMELPKRP